MKISIEFNHHVVLYETFYDQDGLLPLNINLTLTRDKKLYYYLTRLNYLGMPLYKCTDRNPLHSFNADGWEWICNIEKS